MEEESKSSASVLPGEVDDLQDARAPTIAQLLQEKTLYSFSEWPKVSLKLTLFVLQVLLRSPDQQRLTQPQLCLLLLCTWLPTDALTGMLFPSTHAVDTPAPKQFPAELRSLGLVLSLILR